MDQIPRLFANAHSSEKVGACAGCSIFVAQAGSLPSNHPDQRERDQRSPAFELAQQLLFEAAGIDLHFARGDLVVARALEAQLADSDRFRSNPHRRTEGAAGDRTRRVEIASPRLGVERGTGLVIAVIVGEHSSDRVLGERLRDPCDSLPEPVPEHAPRAPDRSSRDPRAPAAAGSRRAG